MTPCVVYAARVLLCTSRGKECAARADCTFPGFGPGLGAGQ